VVGWRDEVGMGDLLGGLESGRRKSTARLGPGGITWNVTGVPAGLLLKTDWHIYLTKCFCMPGIFATNLDPVI